MGRRLFVFIAVAVLAGNILALGSCSKPSSPSTNTVTGIVTVENQTNHQGVTVELYAPVEIDRDLAHIQSLHPDVGLPINNQAMFDHRLANPISSTQTAPDGSYTFETIPPGSFVIVAEREGFGYQQRFDLTVKSSGTTTVPQMELLEEQELAGNLTANIVLTANRHYIVSSDLTVSTGVTLTIEPGVHIKFDGYHTLLINGRMVAMGTEEDMIVFTSGKDVPSKDDWKRIEFTPSSEGGEMCWCKVEYATSGIYAKGVPLTLNYNVVKDNEESGVLVFSTFDIPVEVKNHLITNNNKGLWLENVDNGTVEDNIIYGNQELGVGCQESTPALINNLYMANEYGLYLIYNANPQCRNNALMNNDWGMVCGGYSHPVMHLCHFADNSLGAIYVFQPPRGSQAQPTVSFSNFYEQMGLIRIDGGPMAPNNLDIDASNNFWGGLSVEEIDRLIWDKNDVTPDLAPYIAQVNYLPMQSAVIDSAGLQ